MAGFACIPRGRWLSHHWVFPNQRWDPPWTETGTHWKKRLDFVKSKNKTPENTIRYYLSSFPRRLRFQFAQRNEIEHRFWGKSSDSSLLNPASSHGQIWRNLISSPLSSYWFHFLYLGFFQPNECCLSKAMISVVGAVWNLFTFSWFYLWDCLYSVFNGNSVACATTISCVCGL